MTQILILNVGLFLVIATVGGIAIWLGWMVVGHDGNGHGGDDGVGGQRAGPVPVPPHLPQPVAPWQPAAPEDLARSC